MRVKEALKSLAIKSSMSLETNFREKHIQVNLNEEHAISVH